MSAALPEPIPTIVRLLARVTGSALFVLVAAIAIGHWPLPNPFRQPAPVGLEFVLLAVMALGLLLAWRWERAGALATLAALVGFNAIELAVNGRPAGGLFPLFAIPALLYLLDAWLRRPGTTRPGPAA
ncbi:MAG TPA: hypothetical protein VFB66_24935 [Tepidisphaeraceae bacterium]|nr:hypothetical protein [Tepidisphaeraceae bacterium]